MLDDLEFIRNHGKWPMYPCLPLTRSRTHAKRTGFILASDSLTIYHANIFNFREVDVYDMPGCLCNVEKTHYNSHEEMLNDGWMVD